MPQFSRYQRVFNSIDSDGDGKVSSQDLLTRFAAVTGEELTEEEAAAVVAAYDSDDDGLLEIAEFERLVEDGDGEGKEIKEAFKMYEMEGLGVITAVSLRRMLSQLGQSRSIGDCNRMIAKFDVNGDGVLCFDEFRIMMLL
ncbi:putative calcium-binding protein CML31, partial [Cucurbita argyrosperma subsp. argyrosperma]|uniref:Probable calcium-binding protein CML31 n=2 Tax=Cucurbita TaxID=3660 RepID=A0A6J1HFW4_CUCMO